MSGSMVALRASDPAVVDAVRSVVALADLPLVVHPPGAPPPEAGLALDSAAEIGPGDPEWRGPGRRFAWVAVEPDVEAPDGGTCLVLPGGAEELLGRLRSVATTRRARVIGVVGARGGAGASSLAAVLARTCAEAGLSSGLVDLDLDHGGLDILVGAEHEPGLRWADIADERGGFAPEELVATLPVWRGVRVLSGDLRPVPEPPKEQVLAALSDAHDVIVLDMPRPAARPGDVAVRWCDTVLVAATCDVSAAAGAQTLAQSLAGHDARLVVRGPAPGGMRPDQLAAAAGMPLLHAMAPERALAAALERGVAPGDYRRGPLVRCGRRLVHELGLVP